MFARFCMTASAAVLSAVTAWAGAPADLNKEESCKPSRSGGCAMTQPPAGYEPMSSEREYSAPPQAAQVEFNENSVDIKWIEDMEQSNAKQKKCGI